MVAVHAQFVPVDSRQSARDRLAKLTQTGSVSKVFMRTILSIPHIFFFFDNPAPLLRQSQASLRMRRSRRSTGSRGSQADGAMGSAAPELRHFGRSDAGGGVRGRYILDLQPAGCWTWQTRAGGCNTHGSGSGPGVPRTFCFCAISTAIGPLIALQPQPAVEDKAGAC